MKAAVWSPAVLRFDPSTDGYAAVGVIANISFDSFPHRPDRCVIGNSNHRHTFNCAARIGAVYYLLMIDPQSARGVLQMVWEGVASSRRWRAIVMPTATLAAGAALAIAAGAAQAAGSHSANLAGMSGKPIKPFGRITFPAATLRTPQQMEAFQAAHPQLDLKQPAYRPRITMTEAAYRAAKKLAAEERGGRKFALANIAPPPSSPTKLLLKADGPSQSDTGNATFPPDVSGAVGGGQVVVAVNSTFNVYNRSGQSLLHETLGSLIGTSTPLEEPRVLYDPLWQRWIVATLEVPNASRWPALWLAISKTSNARGAYFIYHVEYQAGPGDVYDYPMVGMTQDGLTFTANYFPSGTTFDGSAIYSVPKARVYNGQFASTNTFLAASASGTLAPPIVLDDAVNAYYIGADTASGMIDLYEGTNLNSPSAYSFNLNAQIPASVGVPPAAPQHNSTQMLDTLDGRFQAPSYQYGNALWNVATSNDSGFSLPRYYEIDTSTYGLTQTGAVFESLSSYDFNPSLAADSNGEFIVTWSATDPTSATGHNARMRYGGGQPGDVQSVSPGSLLETSGPALSGNTESTNLQAWGAYSAVALDANSFSTCSGTPNRRALILNERIVDRNTWGTEMGIVGFC